MGELEVLFERQSAALAIVALVPPRSVCALVRANDAWKALVGPDTDALLGMLPLDRVGAMLATGRSGPVPTFVGFEGGPLELVVVPLDETRFALEATEIDPLVRHAAVLARSQERLELAIAAGALYVWDIDLVEDEVSWDARFAELVGMPLEQVNALGRDLYHPADRELVERARDEHLAGRTPMVSFEARVRTAAGNSTWLSVQGKVVERDEHGAPRRMTGVARDITERKDLEQRVAIAERMASIGTLASGVGHEINNPLTFVIASLSLLREELADMEQAHGTIFGELSPLLVDAMDGAERIRSIVDRLRSLTSAESDATAPVDVAQILDEALKIADHQIRHRARVVRALTVVPPVTGSDGRLLQVFVNLLINAAQSIPSGHIEDNTIRVACLLSGDHVIVEVSDTGSGIAPEVLGRIFDPFFTTKHVGQGTGLGLSISRGIVQRMGGEISVESAIGAGSTFRVRLPVANSVRPPAATHESSRPHGSKLRLLVVDDEVAIGRIITRALSAHEVVAHTDPLKALEELQAGARYDGILLDVMMPAMTGIQFFHALDGIDRALKDVVVFMSGGAFTRETQVFLEGTDRLQLGKPFSVAELKSVIARLG